MAKQCITDRALRRQKELEDSLLVLLQSKDYAQITVTDICRQANIPRRTFYHYFSSKDEIVDSIAEDLMFSCNLSSMFDFASGVEAVQESYLRFFRFWLENREILELLIRQKLEPQLILYTNKWLHTGDVLLPFPDNMNPDLLQLGKSVASSGFFALLFHWCRTGFRETPEEMAGYVTWFMTNPLFQPK